MVNNQLFEKFSKYILVKKIATGGMAEIFLASRGEGLGVNQFVVIKRILPHLSVSKRFKKMFKNEGRVTSKLRHSNMVSIYEFGCTDNQYYIVMEYISGCSLKDLTHKLKKKKVLFSIPSVLNIVRQMASVLHYIHTYEDVETGRPLNLIHRDLSPHNIMIGFNGDIKLIDFGIAKDTEKDHTGTGIIKGKFSYMSPEQVRGETLDYKTDIFSLGIVFWELLTGRRLFSGSNVTNIIDQIKSCKIESISSIRRDVPDELIKIVNSCLHKNKSKRMPSAEQLERSLTLFLNKRYPRFSQFDFQTFVKDLYKTEIKGEKNFFMEVSRKLPEVSPVGNWSGTFFDIDPDKTSASEMEEEKTSSITENGHSGEDQSKTHQFQTEESKVKGDETVVSPEAPVHYSKTVVAPKELNPKEKKEDEEEEFFAEYAIEKEAPPPPSKMPMEESEEFQFYEAPPSQTTSFESLKQDVDYWKRRQEKRAWIAGGAACFVLLVVLYSFRADISDFLFVPEELTQEQQPPEFNYDELAKDPLTAQESPVRGLASVSIFIETLPSGGDIYLNGKKWSNKTPAYVDLPEGDDNQLVIKKNGYYSQTITDFSNSRSFKIKLKRKKR